MRSNTGYQPGVIDVEFVVRFVQDALLEDVGPGDHTSLSTIPADRIQTAKLLVKDDGVIAGIELAKIIFSEVDPKLKVSAELTDGDLVAHGDVAFIVTGPAQSITIAERLVLNCMQRMSGIATTTWKMVKLVSDLPVKIVDTRKTTPLFRYFEKWAVRIGGGHNHRYALYDMILIKDNHVDYAGGTTKAIDAARAYREEKKLDLKIEIEVRNFDELQQVLDHGGVDRIMLDNFSTKDLAQAVAIIGGRYISEASGGITLETVRAYAETGVNEISVGALTHSIRSLDLSLKAVKQ
ncbi:MAG TPA: carboxylating nicotinate-nucleotide diphosphorylase [Bacteroidia bacterium]|nr:carboxylating nicotinate-nucleotide diphosphorylase [Bacteroidia bacterium]